MIQSFNHTNIFDIYDAYDMYDIYTMNLLFLPLLLISLPLSSFTKLISFFQSPYYWPSQHHTPDNIE